jgi:hypothetical protein
MVIQSNKVDKYIDIYGETVTIKIKDDVEYSDWGDQLDTSSTVTAKAIYNVYTQLNQFETDGIFKLGDKTFFFKHNQTNLTPGNHIIRADSSEYEMDDILDPGLYGDAYVYEVKVNRV